MNWLNLEVSTIRAAEYVGSEPVHRAAWLNVMAYSCEHENGGRIIGARKWKDRQWQQTCGVTLAEVDAAAPLLWWDGEDLIVWKYPVEREAEVKAKRAGGKRGGVRSGESRREAQGEAYDEADSEASREAERSSASSTPSRTPRTERKGKEGEWKGKEPPTPKGGGSATPETAEGKRIAALFRRRETTPWAKQEIRLFRGLVKSGLMTSENLDTLERYYSAERAKGEDGIHRRDLKTFLNNFQGELDRAAERGMATRSSSTSADPPGWREWLESVPYPYQAHRFATPFLKDDFANFKKSKP